MPMHHLLRRHRGYGRRRMRGRGIMDLLGKANSFLKNTQLLSKGAAALAPHAGRFGNYVTQAGNIAGSLGYGRRRRAGYGRRRHMGHGLRLAGM